MQAQETLIKLFLSQQGTKFIIPVYQRNYDWKRKQCEQLLKDINTVGDNQQYFIGSIVHKRSNSLSGNQELVIIDGQQRITTLTIFLFRLTQIFKENNDSTSEEIWDYFIQNKHDNSTEKLKLKPIISDLEVFKNLVNGNLEQIPDGNRILDNYLFFKENITSYEEAKKLYANFNHLTIVEIALHENDDPQKIFQSLNSTGLELSQADLIRNFLLMNLDYGYQERVFQNFWSVIEKNCIKEDINESYLTLFFRDYLTFKFNSIPSYNNIFESFKKKFPEIHNSKEIFEAELEQMKIFSGIYCQFINPDRVRNSKISMELKNLIKMEVTVSYPFLLGIFMDLNTGIIDEQVVVNVLNLIQSFVFRRFICGVPTNALNKIFMTLHGNAKKLRDKNTNLSYLDSIETVLIKYTSYQRFPTDQEVTENLKLKDVYSTQSKNKLYLLERLENEYDNFVENNIDLFEREDISIEHIFPQNPSEDWKSNLTAEEYTEFERKRNTLANLTIVINNSSLGNRPFKEKRELNLEKSKGYKYSKFKLNEYLSSLDEWSLKNLQERGNLLTDKFLHIWQYPNVKIPPEPQEDIETDLVDIEDSTGKLIKYYILDGVKFDENAYIDIYKRVLKTLYFEYFDQLFSTEIKENIEISMDKSIFRKPIEIESGYCVEGNLSSQSIITKLKKLNDILENAFELRICFKEGI